MSKTFQTTRRVEFRDTDMAGIVHFANFYVYMEQVDHEFFRSLGLHIINRQADGTTVSWPRVKANCSFHAPAHYDDVLDVRLILERIGEKSLTYHIEFHRGETKIAVGTMKTVCVRFGPEKRMESIAIPPEYAEKLEPYAVG